MVKAYSLMEEMSGGEGGGGAAGGDAAAAAAASASAAKAVGEGAGAGAGDGGKAAAAAGDAAPKPDWADDWVKKMSPDEGVQKRLSRYASPKAVGEALIAAQNKIASGELKARVDFPAKGTAEEQTAWRAENGIPAAPDKYELKFDNGMVIGDEDKPIVEDFLKAAHAANVPTGAAKTAVEWYFKTIEERVQAQQELNDQAKEATENALRTEWGGEFAGMRNRIKTLVQMAPPEVATKIMDARFTDGTAIFNNADVMRWLGGMAKVLIPTTTIVPGDEAAVAAQVEDRITEIDKMMKDPKGAYWKGSQSKKLQEEYRSLLEHKAATKSK